MQNTLLISSFQVVLSLGFLWFLAHKEYWYALATFAAIFLLIKYVNTKHKDSDTTFDAILSSIVQVSTYFTIIAAFGCANLVSWWIITPILITWYLISYTALRIGIATKAKGLAREGSLKPL